MRAKLRTLTPVGHAPRVDRSGNGRIIGASLMAVGPALGHGFEIDETTIDQVAALAEGTPGRWTHGNLCADGLGTHLGRWQNVRREGSQAVGDFAFSAAAKQVRPAGLSVDAATYLMDLAEKEPDVAGVSAVIDYEAVEGEPLTEGGEPRMLARVGRVLRADFVGDPAANASGMFSDSPSALAEQATEALKLAEENYGQERVAAFLRAHLGANAPTNTTRTAMDVKALTEAHAAELAARDQSIAALQATVAEFKAAEAKRRADEIEGYLASLKSSAAPAALDENKLGLVRSLLTSGMDEAAKAFGSTLLQNAKNGAGAALGGTVVAMGTAPNSPEEMAKRGKAALFAAAGIKE